MSTQLDATETQIPKNPKSDTSIKPDRELSIQVTPMTESDIEGAIDCIQLAFEHDPFKTFIFSDSKFSPERNRASLRLRCRWGMKHGLFQVARSKCSSNSAKILGVAMWEPPHSHPHWIHHWRLSMSQFYLNMWYGRGGLNTKRFWAWKKEQATVQKELCTEGYYFGNIVAVLPGSQQAGVGRAFAKEMFGRADREGVGCYLESSRLVPNVGIYEKFGFRLVREIVVRDVDEEMKLYAMVRHPRPIGDASEVGRDRGVRAKL